MTQHFVYVFSEQDRDALQALGYVLLKSDKKNNVYIFENQDNMKFSAYDINFVLSNTLTF